MKACTEVLGTFDDEAMVKVLSLHSLKAFTVATQIIAPLGSLSHSVLGGGEQKSPPELRAFYFQYFVAFP